MIFLRIFNLLETIYNDSLYELVMPSLFGMDGRQMAYNIRIALAYMS